MGYNNLDAEKKLKCYNIIHELYFIKRLMLNLFIIKMIVNCFSLYCLFY